MPVYKLLIITEYTHTFEEFILQLGRTQFMLSAMVNFSEALDAQFSFAPDIVIIDSGKDNLSAIEMCVSIKSFNRLKGCVVIIVSDKKNDIHEISSFHSGADDFLILPLSVNVLIERMKTRLNKSGNEITIIQEDNNAVPLKISRDSYTVSLGDNCIQLSRKEFDLLFLMASNPNKMFDRQELFQTVWNEKFNSQNRTLDVYMAKLRQKIGSRFFSTQKGIGYRFIS